MNKMKDSGVEWLETIPDGWKIAKYKYFSQSRMGETILANDLVEKGIPVYSATNNDELFGYVSSAKVVLHKGDLVIPARGNSIGFMKFVNYDLATCTQTTICSFNIKGINRRFLYYCNYALKEEWYRFDGAAIPQVTVEQIKNNYLPYPPINIQKKIADFLDKRCSRIEIYVEKQKRIIEKLKEYKVSMIMNCVTKGLKPNVKMKDSRIEWIGDIPKDWDVTSFSSLFYQHKQKNVESKENNLLSLSYGRIKQKDISSNMGLLPESFDNYNIVYPGNIVFRLTDLQNDKKSLRTGLCTEKGIITSAYVTVALKDSDSAEYMQYLFFSYDTCKVFYSMGDGVRQSMTYNDLKKIPILRPPIKEQKLIAEYINKKSKTIEELIMKKEHLVDALLEYKKSLIYEVITGKKEII